MAVARRPSFTSCVIEKAKPTTPLEEAFVELTGVRAPHGAVRRVRALEGEAGDGVRRA
jgi:hypothetical protein